MNSASNLTEIYVIALIVLAVCMLLSVVVANAIAYEPGVNPRDGKKRKTWFWVFSVLPVICTFILGYVMVYKDITIPSAADSAMLHLCISSVAGTVLYIVIGFVLSKAFKRSKLGTWF